VQAGRPSQPDLDRTPKTGGDIGSVGAVAVAVAIFLVLAAARRRCRLCRRCRRRPAQQVDDRLGSPPPEPEGGNDGTDFRRRRRGRRGRRGGAAHGAAAAAHPSTRSNGVVRRREFPASAAACCSSRSLLPVFSELPVCRPSLPLYCHFTPRQGFGEEAMRRRIVASIDRTDGWLVDGAGRTRTNGWFAIEVGVQWWCTLLFCVPTGSVGSIFESVPESRWESHSPG
jgi:hypothetical protein